jgi:hypothetical protein
MHLNFAAKLSNQVGPAHTAGIITGECSVLALLLAPFFGSGIKPLTEL